MTTLAVALLGAGLFFLAALLAARAPGRVTAAVSSVAGVLLLASGLAVLLGAPPAALRLTLPLAGEGAAFDVSLEIGRAHV